MTSTAPMTAAEAREPLPGFTVVVFFEDEDGQAASRDAFNTPSIITASDVAEEMRRNGKIVEIFDEYLDMVSILG